MTVRSFRPLTRSRYLQTERRRSPLAFAFDIDGVLIHGPSVLPEAKRALKILNGGNRHGLQIPYILMTNGGGISEADRCVRLSNALGVPVQSSQLVQAHTILRSLAHKYANEPVLVLGGINDSHLIGASSYGYKKAYNSLDVHAWNPSIWPFHRLTPDEQASTKKVDFAQAPFRAIFVFSDPRNWGLDIQIMVDVLRAKGGVIGAPHLDENERNGVELVFCNPDLVWRSDFPRLRFGQGAFREAFQAVFKTMTGETYPYTQYGKPMPESYNFAKDLLLARANEVEGNMASGVHEPTIYMVGDNPESDIAGANAANWPSILVRTGVYDPAKGLPTHRPTVELENVEEAVKWALEREGVEL
ncbi:HAD-like domain-containing protein [Mycena epipterygia]|nr:HAD-like domain-containing protein [Mycena epipterygia]